VESKTTATCNGDGSGTVDNSSLASVPERNTFWKHLANAGLIEGNYTGDAATQGGNTICVDATNNFIAGCNVPASKLPNGQWSVDYRGTLTGNAFQFDGQYGNVLALGKSPGSGSFDELILPDDLWNIDTKMDDGMPGTGKLVGSRFSWCTTGAATSADFAIARYRLGVTGTNVSCMAIFRNVF
jgi:hypothetical protein